MTLPANQPSKAQEWQRRLLHCVAALLVFETLTGLAIYLLPFSVSNQIMVLAHTMAGVGFVLPFAYYQIRHWRLYRSIRLSHVVLTGYLATAATLVLIVSGLVLTYQAMFAMRIGRAWDLAHVIATFALIAAVIPHVGALMIRAARARLTAAGAVAHHASRRFGRLTTYLLISALVPVMLATAVYRPPALVNELPADYSYVFGADRVQTGLIGNRVNRDDG